MKKENLKKLILAIEILSQFNDNLVIIDTESEFEEKSRLLDIASKEGAEIIYINENENVFFNPYNDVEFYFSEKEPLGNIENQVEELYERKSQIL